MWKAWSVNVQLIVWFYVSVVGVVIMVWVWSVMVYGVAMQLKTAEVQYSGVLMRWLLEKADRSKQCAKVASQHDEERKDNIVQREIRYQVRVTLHVM